MQSAHIAAVDDRNLVVCGPLATYIDTYINRKAVSQVCMEAEVIENTMFVGGHGAETLISPLGGRNQTTKTCAIVNKFIQFILTSHGNAHARKSRFPTPEVSSPTRRLISYALPKSKAASRMTSLHMPPPLWLARLTSAS
jgi:hypothetical protein